MADKINLTFFQAKKEVYKGGYLSDIEYWAVEKDFDNFAQYAQALCQTLILKTLGEDWTLSEEEDSFKLIIVFIDNNALGDRKVFEEMFEKAKIRQTTDYKTRRFADSFAPNPIIFIGVDNIMGLNGCKPIKESQSQPEEDKCKSAKGSQSHPDGLLNKIHEQIDPRFRILDASIWNTYVALFPPISFEKRLKDAITSIVDYHENGLFKTVVAQEFLEFQCRKLRDSYVKSYPGGHAKRVTPFRFHSESKMKELAGDKLTEIRKKAPYTWGCLLVDDYASEPLRSMDTVDDGSEEKITNKLDWIEHILNPNPEKDEPVKFLKPNKFWTRKGPTQEGEEKIKGYLDYYIYLLQHPEKVNDKRPDIIILDYFFGIGETDPDQRYGHHFIKMLKGHKESRELPKTSMAFNKYWLFPISAFEHAFRSHLRLMGYSTGSEMIEIGDGADPINSPELFRYLFYSFLLYQGSSVSLDFDLIKNRLNEKKEGDKVPNPLFKELLKQHYDQLVGMTTRFNWLLDEKDISYLADSVQKDASLKTLKRIVVHFQSLISAIVYGSSWEWRKMWEEYLLLEDSLRILELEKNKKSQDLIPDDLLESIWQYIEQLKNGYR